MRRITGRSLGTVFREEIAEPLGADFHIGLPASEDDRVADLVPPPPGAGISAVAEASLSANMANNPGIDVLATRTRAWRRRNPSGGRHRKRALGCPGPEHSGQRRRGRRSTVPFRSRLPKGIELQIEGIDLVLGIPVRYGLGFGLQEGLVPLPNSSCMYWGGYGGSIVIIDMESRTCIAYVMNRMEVLN